MKLPMSLSIIWSHIQSKPKGSLSDWVSEPIEYKNLHEYLNNRVNLFNSSEYNLLLAWINSFYDNDIDSMIPSKYWSSTSLQLTESGTDMEVPEKVIYFLCYILFLYN